MCLIIKSGSKIVKISNTLYENGSHRVDSSPNEDSENMFFASKTLILGEGRPENLGKMA